MSGGYSTELYETIAAFGLKRGASILDLGSEEDAGAPFAANGCEVTRTPGSEDLAFPAERFDLVISAQAFHRFDRTRALEEAYRVLKHDGIVAIWWRDLSALPVGFREFYASQQFADQTLRVLPSRTAGGMTMQYLYLARKR